MTAPPTPRHSSSVPIAGLVAQRRSDTVDGFEITLDPGSGSDQEYSEDCQVCCRAWLLHVRYGRDGHAEVEVIRADS